MKRYLFRDVYTHTHRDKAIFYSGDDSTRFRMANFREGQEMVQRHDMWIKKLVTIFSLLS